MRKLILTAVMFLLIGLGAITGALFLDPTTTWYSIVLVFGGIMVGGCASLLTLARLSEDNPNIIAEIEKVDKMH